jgi:hypothetical protein
MGGYIRAVSGQRLGKDVPAATYMNVTMVQQQRKGVFCGPAVAVATQRRGKLISATTNPDITTEELCFYVVRSEML